MSKFKSKFRKLDAKNKHQERIANRSLKKVSELEALMQVQDSKLGYAIKDTIREEICYYGVLLEYVESKGQDINFLKNKVNSVVGDLELYNIMIEIYLQPAYEFTHDTFDMLVEQGYDLGQYDNDAKEYIENKARNLDSIANTDDIVEEFKNAIISTYETVSEWN